MQIVDNYAAAFISDLPPLFCRLIPHLILGGVKLGDAAQHFEFNRRAVGELVKLAPDMCPGEGETDLLPPRQRGVAAIAVDLQDAGEVAEVRLRPFALAVGGHRQSRRRPAPVNTSKRCAPLVQHHHMTSS